MLTIKSEFKDYIDRIIYYNSAKPTITKQVIIFDEHDKAYMIDLFKSCVSFSIGNESITFIVNKTDEEIQKDLDDYKARIKNSINRLNWWCGRDEADKLQITTYLKGRGLDWILNRLL